MEIVEVNTTVAREHVPEIERLICLIKERVRCTTSDFPFNSIPRLVLIHVFYTCFMWLNDIPRKAVVVQGISHRKLVTGRTVNYKRDCRACMGGYVEASTDEIVTNEKHAMYPQLHRIGPVRETTGFR